jgi:hypothetical protein
MDADKNKTLNALEIIRVDLRSSADSAFDFP